MASASFDCLKGKIAEFEKELFCHTCEKRKRLIKRKAVISK